MVMKMPRKINPIIEALDGINENTAIAAAPQKRRMKTPLKIVIISVAAVMLLGTTAAAATFGDEPIIRINNKQITPMISCYVDDQGRMIDTLSFELPNDVIFYRPVGEIRSVYDPEELDSYKLYDELGVELNNLTRHLYIRTLVSKNGEKISTSRRFGLGDKMHFKDKGGFLNPGENEDISVEIWQDPIQALTEAVEKKRFDRMSIEEKCNFYLTYGWDIGYPDYGGFEHPSMREIITADATYIGGAASEGEFIYFNGLPSEAAARYYNYTLDQPSGFTEKDGVQVIFFTNGKFDNETYQWVFPDGQNITQEMFIYTMTDNESGKDVQFTVWRSAEKKEVNTDCFDFYYEYIPLKNGTEARIHQSVDYNYIVEFEKDGAAYAFVTDPDTELVLRVLENMDLL